MRLEPLQLNAPLIVSGKVQLNHQYQNHPTIDCLVSLRIIISSEYPKIPPVFEEIGDLIPKTGDYHVNPDGTLCLASPLRLLLALSENSCINNFHEKFFIPYAYAALLKLHHKIDFVFGELSHGDEGLLEDFHDVFGVNDKDSVVACLKALSQKKKIANKNTCPCGCGKRLGSCKLNYIINQYRNLLTRNQYSRLAKSVNGII